MIEAAPFFSDVADAPEGAEALWLRASDGTRLRIAVWSRGSRGTAIVFPGRTEYIEKYGRVVRRLVERGFSVVVIDWRGQGLSDRHPASPRLGHIEDFQHYQLDVEALLDHVRGAGLPGPLRLFCHSMGGCIGLRSVVERTDFASAVFSAPMWDLPLGAAAREFATHLTRFATVIGLGARLMPGTSAEPMLEESGYEDNSLTSDREHFVWALRQVNRYPELALGGPSLNWTGAAFSEMTRMRAVVATLPALGFLGTRERVVSQPAIREMFERMPHGELVICRDARHEIFQEQAGIETMVWSQIDTFLERIEG